MSPKRRARLVALGEWHDEWTKRHLPDAPFHPEDWPEGSDYNLHYLDVEATPEQEDESMSRAREIMGSDPETGHRVD